MSSNVFTTIAVVCLLFSSIVLESVLTTSQAVLSEAICWGIILLCSELYRNVSGRSSRKFGTRSSGQDGLYVVVFGATLLCLSYSILGASWSFAPLLSLGVPFLKMRPYSFLGARQEAESKEPLSNRFMNKQVIGLYIYGVVAAIALTRENPLSILPVNVCWILAQLVVYAGLFDRTKALNGTYVENFKEALNTLSDLALLMICTTLPLSLLSWSNSSIGFSILLAAVVKVLYWTSILILAHEAKVHIPIWTTIFTICTSALWTYQLDWRVAIIVLATCVALYHISTAFPQSLYGKCITFVLILYPIWAIGSHPEIRSNVPALVASSSLPVFTFTSTLQHPAQILVERARKSFADKLSKQSRTLDEAVSEYVRRYKRSPPPGFDKWFHFAKENNVQFIDEYDLMTKSFEPFWAAEPRVLRNYIDQAIEIDGANLNTLDVKQGKATLSGGSFQHAQLIELLGPVMRFLPDLKAPLNEFDEPRVIIPYDQLTNPIKPTSSSPETSINPIYLGQQDKQRVWETITLSCPPDSLARSDSSLQTAAKNSLDLPFITNLSESQDICQWPSSASTKHGFLSSPSTFHYTHHRVPILATAKFSTFHDILMPSSYYFQGDIAAVDDSKDTAWQEKKDLVYWRGTGTGGHWTGHSWKMGHRQRFVDFANKPEQDITLLQKSTETNKWSPFTSKMSTVLSKFLVKFSKFIQCDEADCKEQEDYFHKAPMDGNNDASNYKILYNLDGNSFSGRYYRFLKSNSLVFMQAMFKEWHDDRLLPWVHFVPISNSMEELPEITRYLLDDEDGKKIAERMALESREWSRKTLRKVDLSAAYLRVLLEYHRILQDDRDSRKCC